jgi:membrane-bound lytic murein transglycosylase A
MSMQAIRHWGETHSEAEVRELLEQNPSFVFFKPQSFAPVKGASAVPLIGRASVASDRSIIPAGTTLLAEVPLLDNNGKFTGQYELRLMVALDVGGAIKGSTSTSIRVLALTPDTVPGGIITTVAYGY